MIVVDTSVLITALLDNGVDGRAIRTRLAGERLAAPEIIDLEVTSVLRRLIRTGSIGHDQVAATLNDLIDLPLERASHRHLISRCWELRENLTVYDAAYVALAEHLNVPLWTSDARLAGAPGVRCEVTLFGDRSTDP